MNTIDKIDMILGESEKYSTPPQKIKVLKRLYFDGVGWSTRKTDSIMIPENTILVRYKSGDDVGSVSKYAYKYDIKTGLGNYYVLKFSLDDLNGLSTDSSIK